MTNLGLVSFTVVSRFDCQHSCCSDVVIVECINNTVYLEPTVSASSYTEARTEYSNREFQEEYGQTWESSVIQVYDFFYWNF